MSRAWTQYSGKWNLPTQMQAKGAGTWTGISQNELWSWGANSSGQLGLGDTANRSTPAQVGGVDWSAIAACSSGSLAIKEDGTLWSWGSGQHGALGQGNTTNYSSPVQVGALTNWSTVAAGPGSQSGWAIKTDGSLWAWGQNNSGQLGLGNTTYRSSPVQVGALTTWSQIAANGFCVAIKTDGTLWSWGRGGSGELGLGNTTSYSSPVQVGALTTWSKVSIASGHTLAVKTDGTLWSWGSNFNGQLGDGTTTNRSSPVQVGALTTWLNVAGSQSNASLAINTSGQLFSWGRNVNGQLGLGDTTQRNSPVQVGALTDWSKIFGGNTLYFAIKAAKTLWGWGLNSSGQLGLDDTTQRNSPVQVGALTSWGQIAASSHSIAINQTTT